MAGLGGGIQNDASLTVKSSTVRGNSVFGVGGGIGGGGTTSLKNTIVANNASDDCAGSSITSAGHNLIENIAGCAIGGDTTGNIIGFDPLLGPLTDNGGPTQTHALLEGSPATDAGSSDCPPPATDQRGVTRPQGAACDIGAFEAIPPFVEVTIDIKPGSFPNSVNPRNRGTIPVAILSTTSFDAAAVNVTTVRFGPTGTEAVPVQFALEDVNADGHADLILHFNTQDTGIVCGDTSASLTGETFGGQAIAGSDSLKTVGCK